MNWGIKVLQTSALPLGYVAISPVSAARSVYAVRPLYVTLFCFIIITFFLLGYKDFFISRFDKFGKANACSAESLLLARVAGFEPAHDGIRIHCLTAWRYPNIK